MNYRKLKITEMGRMSVEEFHEAEKMPLVVVLDSVRSLYNVGSVFRTCDAFRVAGVVLCGITATPPNLRNLKLLCSLLAFFGVISRTRWRQ